MSWGAISTSSYGDPEGLGDELREDRLRPLAHLGRGGQDPERALAVSSSETTMARWTSPRPGEPGPVPGQRQPDPGRGPLADGPERRRRDGPGAVARLPRCRVARPHVLELAGLSGPLEDLLARDAVTQDLAGRGHVAGHVDVAPADLERADPECLGDPVEVRLRRELDLRRPEPAERAVGRRVGPRRPGGDPDVRAAVRPAGMDGAAATGRPV